MNVPAPPIQGDLVGAILSQKYALKRLIGAGGMGAVYESTSPEDGKPVAVKVLGIDHLGDEEVKARFVEEGRTCMRLIHPNIVRVFEVATAEDGTPYIAMELLDGVPLSAYTRASVRVPPQQAAMILQGILAGLGAAHAQAIVHRDLKPENVVLAREPGGTFTAKILDFGIAKVMDAAGGMGNKTKTGVLLGTPAYMSPEQIKNAKDVDARSDLWSAGVMLYEMLTGRVAFPAPTEYARLNAVLNTTPPAAETVDPSLSRLSSFVQLAMQKDRAGRFQSALEMARALSAAMGADATAQQGAVPISRLPDVPSVWMPHVGKPASGTLAQPAPQTMGAGPLTMPTADAKTDKGPGGTLASRQGAGRPVSEPAPQISFVRPGNAGTLPSENLPMLPARRGVAPLVVVLLVAGALIAGILLGFAGARMLH